MTNSHSLVISLQNQNLQITILRVRPYVVIRVYCARGQQPIMIAQSSFFYQHKKMDFETQMTASHGHFDPKIHDTLRKLEQNFLTLSAVCTHIHSLSKENIKSEISESIVDILINITLQCVTIEFRQGPVYVVNSQFSRCPDRC